TGMGIGTPRTVSSFPNDARCALVRTAKACVCVAVVGVGTEKEEGVAVRSAASPSLSTSPHAAASIAEGRGSAGGRAGSRVGGCTNCVCVWTCGCEWARVGWCGGDCGWSETWCGCAWGGGEAGQEELYLLRTERIPSRSLHSNLTLRNEWKRERRCSSVNLRASASSRRCSFSSSSKRCLRCAAREGAGTGGARRVVVILSCLF
ncbi:hypothetical protein B0H13DRAFT_2155071, partial [Mycena leptocephala]